MKNDLDKYGYRRRARKDFNLWDAMDETGGPFPEPDIPRGGLWAWIAWGGMAIGLVGFIGMMVNLLM